MPRPEKVAAVAEIKDRIDSAQAVFLAEYAGLSVKDQQKLRRGLREQGAEFKVMKMTLARLAVADLEIDSLDDLLLGPTGMAFADGDPVSAAKVLKDFAAEHEVFTIKGGLLGRDPLSPERISQLADIEPREVLLAKLAGAMKAPMGAMANLLSVLPRSVATMVQQLIDKKVAAGESAAPVEEPAEAVAAVDDAPANDDSSGAADDESTEDPSDAAEEPAAEESATEDAAGDAVEEPVAEASATEDAAEEIPAEETATEEAAEASATEETAADTAEEE